VLQYSVENRVKHGDYFTGKNYFTVRKRAMKYRYLPILKYQYKQIESVIKVLKLLV